MSSAGHHPRPGVEEIIAVALLALGATTRTPGADPEADTEAGTGWYADHVPLSRSAVAEGKLARITLWHLTDAAARGAHLL